MSECWERMSEHCFFQIRNMFGFSPYEEEFFQNERVKIEKASREAYLKTITCLQHFKTSYYKGGIDPFNSVQYCVYLYWMSRMLYERELNSIADKVYYLNKALNSVDMFYAIELPSCWGCEHPVGSVLGRAQYEDSFFFYQGCTVGGSRKDGEIYYPKMGSNVTMFAGSKIIGKCCIGDNVVCAANSMIINQDVEADRIVFGCSPNIEVKRNNKTQRELLGLQS